MVLSDRTYSVGKFLAQIVLPALGTLYFALAAIWNLPAPERVIGTITAVDAFLGFVLGISSRSYLNSDAPYAGVLKIHEGSEQVVFALELNEHPDDLQNHKQVTFKVESPSQ